MNPYDVLERIDDYLDAFTGIREIAIADYNGMPIPIKNIDVDLENKRIMIYMEQE